MDWRFPKKALLFLLAPLGVLSDAPHSRFRPRIPKLWLIGFEISRFRRCVKFLLFCFASAILSKWKVLEFEISAHISLIFFLPFYALNDAPQSQFHSRYRNLCSWVYERCQFWPCVKSAHVYSSQLDRKLAADSRKRPFYFFWRLFWPLVIDHTRVFGLAILNYV